MARMCQKGNTPKPAPCASELLSSKQTFSQVASFNLLRISFKNNVLARGLLQFMIKTDVFARGVLQFTTFFVQKRRFGYRLLPIYDQSRRVRNGLVPALCCHLGYCWCRLSRGCPHPTLELPLPPPPAGRPRGRRSRKQASRRQAPRTQVEEAGLQEAPGSKHAPGVKS